MQNRWAIILSLLTEVDASHASLTVEPWDVALVLVLAFRLSPLYGIEMHSSTKELCCGMLGGVCAKVIESPFDTVKVRLQFAPGLSKNSIQCALHIARSEGFRGFFRGLPAPMVAGGSENAISFLCFSWGLVLHDAICSMTIPPDPLPRSDSPVEVCRRSLCSIVFAGALSGFACSFTLTPLELVKCSLQVQDLKPRDERPFRGVLHCGVTLVRTRGLRYLYQGHCATMARETPGNAGFFLVYHLAKHALATQEELSKETIPTWKLLLAGGCGGLGYWAAFFPADVVKTKIQVDPRFADYGLRRALIDLYVRGGFRALYAGFGVTALRAFPANAVLFTVYEYTTRLPIWR